MYWLSFVCVCAEAPGCCHCDFFSAWKNCNLSKFLLASSILSVVTESERGAFEYTHKWFTCLTWHVCIYSTSIWVRQSKNPSFCCCTMAPHCNEPMPVLSKTYKWLCNTWNAKLSLNVKKSRLNWSSGNLDNVLQTCIGSLRNEGWACLWDAPINNGGLVN